MEIKQIFREAAAIKNSGFKLLYKENGTGLSRMAVTTPRNYGNAVERNRTKRIIREVFRKIKEQLKSNGYDILFVVYKKDLEYKDTILELFSICGQAGILNVSE
ncbi:MAG: ribonuclease P protein component [Spirochaetia bacterium]|nr:ribonuclease P protein component [Spirochaetia bacterium]